MSLPDPEREAWEHSGLTDPAAPEEPRIGRAHHDHETWLVPREIWLDRLWDGHLPVLRWRGPFNEGSITPDILDRFVELSAAPEETIISFARRFGVLNPPGTDRPDGVSYGLVSEQRRGNTDDGRYEPIKHWRHWSARMRAGLNVAVALANNDYSNLDDWGVFIDGPDREAIRTDVTWLGTGRPGTEEAFFAEELNRWLKLGGVGLGVSASATGFSVRTTGSGLFGALASQFMLTATKSRGLAFCAGCGSLFTPGRHPRVGNDSWCDRCRQNNASRNAASRRHRLKKKAERGSDG